MSAGSIRRAQLVSPFGVGAMSVLLNGTSVITGGLDHWFSIDDPNLLELNEYIAGDWRLERRLQVREFRLPPDFRVRRRGNDNRNTNIKVPVLRFPRWSFCMYCKRLAISPLSMAQPVDCPDASHTEEANGKRRLPRMSQVPFVSICVRGHLDDFPFREWVHKDLNPRCSGVLRLQSRGGGGLDGQVVTCDPNAKPSGCGAERSLEGIMSARWENQVEHTYLTDNLAGKSQPFECGGTSPWLGQTRGTCGEPIRGALRGAGNVYFPKVESSIYLPRKVGAVSSELHDLLNRADVRPLLRLLNRTDGEAVTAQQIRDEIPPELFQPITDEQLLAGYQDMFGIAGGDGSGGQGGGDGDGGDVDDAESLTSTDVWRHPEFRLLREAPADDMLTVTDPGMHARLEGSFGRVRRIETLTETRALRGFTRVRDDDLKLSAGKALLRRRLLPPAQDWLPAYVVKGEGIYLELNLDHLATWEEKSCVMDRAQTITDKYGDVARLRGTQARSISPRFVLIHTLAHLLINELIFTCGYSSASLRERLYVSETPDREMAGLLIYTAAGDSEGTMGGLVRMAKPEHLQSVLSTAVGDARWCSTDPVCMDAGEKGQGPDSCNLAACHGCALLPETSCEEFNRFLDRGMVVGTFDDPSVGYFAEF